MRGVKREDASRPVLRSIGQGERFVSAKLWQKSNGVVCYRQVVLTGTIASCPGGRVVNGPTATVRHANRCYCAAPPAPTSGLTNGKKTTTPAYSIPSCSPTSTTVSCSTNERGGFSRGDTSYCKVVSGVDFTVWAEGRDAFIKR